MKIQAVVLTLGILASSWSQASNCEMAVLKTYIPRGPGKVVCDQQGLPAEFAGNLSTLFSKLRSLNYVPFKYDQCNPEGESISPKYSMMSQLGDCQQTGLLMFCRLYVGIYENATSKVVYENTIEGVGLGAVTLHLSTALANAPVCQ